MRKMVQELQFLTILKQRSELTDNEKKKYYQLQQGFEGEKELDLLQNILTADTLTCMDDLVIRTHSSCVQIDKLLVMNDIAYVIDVKNYSSSYTFFKMNGHAMVYFFKKIFLSSFTMQCEQYNGYFNKTIFL